MQNMEARIREAKAVVNRCRNEINRPGANGYNSVIGHREPGDKGYIPPVEEFITIEFHNGIVVMPVESFNKLSKAKKNKLMKW